MKLEVVHYEVEPERTFIDYAEDGTELYLGEDPELVLTGIPTANPATEDVPDGITHYAAGTRGAIRRGFSELSVWHGRGIPEGDSSRAELARLGLAVLFSHQWVRAARQYRRKVLHGIPADVLNGGAYNPDFDHEELIRLETLRWEEDQRSLKQYLKLNRTSVES
jgi:hypothetical protein